MSRLWLRNMGRDDRLVADTGREARHPFLDEHLVACLIKTPLAAVTDLRLPPGTGDKRILRAALRFLGLPRASVLAFLLCFAFRRRITCFPIHASCLPCT